jgi:hypothetical protein
MLAASGTHPPVDDHPCRLSPSIMMVAPVVFTILLSFNGRAGCGKALPGRVFTTTARGSPTRDLSTAGPDAHLHSRRSDHRDGLGRRLPQPRPGGPPPPNAQTHTVFIRRQKSMDISTVGRRGRGMSSRCSTTGSNTASWPRALFGRFASRGNNDVANRVLGAMREQFGGHENPAA